MWKNYPIVEWVTEVMTSNGVASGIAVFVDSWARKSPKHQNSTSVPVTRQLCQCRTNRHSHVLVAVWRRRKRKRKRKRRIVGDRRDASLGHTLCFHYEPSASPISIGTFWRRLWSVTMASRVMILNFGSFHVVNLIHWKLSVLINWF